MSAVRRLRRRVVAGAALLALLALPAPGGTAVPGENGTILFGRGGDLWRMDPVTTEAVNITNTPEIVENRPAVSPDGTLVAYERPSEVGSMGTNDGIWVAGIDGSNPHDVTASFRDDFLEAAAPTWASDGSLIAFEASDNAYPYNERIFVAKADGSGGMAVTPPNEQYLEPAWSPAPGSTELAVVKGTDIWILDIASGATRLVLNGFDLGFSAPSDPDWAPDGSGLVMSCSHDICAVDADGANFRFLEQQALLTSMPAYSPDGTQVVFSATDDTGIYQIGTIPASGMGDEYWVYTSGADGAWYPAWAPVPGSVTPPPPPPPDDSNDPPAPEPGRVSLFDGDPATTERVDLAPATTAAIGMSQAVFADGTAPFAVLSRDDAFADSLAGTALVGEGPLLFTRSDHLTTSTREELQRALVPGGRVYLLGGTAAISALVESTLGQDGYDVVRLAGDSRIETALAVADEALALYGATDVLVARAYGAVGNETSGWADSVTAGGVAAMFGAPIVLTPTESLHAAVASWLDAAAFDSITLLGGTSALSTAVEQSLPGAVRVAGPERTATAAAIATQLWGVDTSGPRAFVIINGSYADGWAYGLAASLLAMRFEVPLLPVTDRVTDAVLPLVGSCGDPEVDLVLVGDDSVIPIAIEQSLDTADGGGC